MAPRGGNPLTLRISTIPWSSWSTNTLTPCSGWLSWSLGSENAGGDQAPVPPPPPKQARSCTPGNSCREENQTQRSVLGRQYGQVTGGVSGWPCKWRGDLVMQGADPMMRQTVAAVIAFPVLPTADSRNESGASV